MSALSPACSGSFAPAKLMGIWLALALLAETSNDVPAVQAGPAARGNQRSAVPSTCRRFFQTMEERSMRQDVRRVTRTLPLPRRPRALAKQDFWPGRQACCHIQREVSP
jgi:hypothetical protein